MTAHSQIVPNSNPLGSMLALPCAAMPPGLRSALALDRAKFSDWRPDEAYNLKALSKARAEGYDLALIPELARLALLALQPVEHGALVDRLTMLGMSMANGKDSDQVRAWLHETARLLSDLPQGILSDAIDECVKEPGRVFVPSVGEIREKAAPILAREEYAAARLQQLARLIEEGAEIPEWVPPRSYRLEPGPEFRAEDRCTPEEARKILAENGFHSHFADKMAERLGEQLSGPPKTRAELIAEGITPPPLNTDPDNRITV